MTAELETEPKVGVTCSAVTHIGNWRTSNQDAYLARPPIFLVADGLGGHALGDVAARLVVEAFSAGISGRWVAPDEFDRALRVAVERVQELEAPGRPPGSTLSGAALSLHGGVPYWLVFNVGDSRTYLLRNRKLRQVTLDHSASQTTPGQATAKSPITRAVGAGFSGAVADQWLIPVSAGDRLLICSDGLSNEVSAELLETILRSESNGESAVNQLLAAALRAGGHDNVTAVVVECSWVKLPESVEANPPMDSDEDTLRDDWGCR